MTTQLTKTVAFIGVAVLLCAAAYFTRPVAPVQSDTQIVGQKLFPDFTEPGKVESLRVVQFDQKGGKPVALEVAKVNNLWVIPSHAKYPADADTHLAEAANAFIGLKVIGSAPGFSPGSPPWPDKESLRKAYNEFGVVDPEPADAVRSTDTGVGTLVTLKDGSGAELASAIIGKTVADQTNQCYLREPGKDPVYIVQLDPSKISTHFADWIEPNLLKLNTMDLKEVRIINYVMEEKTDARTGETYQRPTRKGEFRIDVPAEGQPWKLAREAELDPSTGKLVDAKLAADEEMSTANLDAMKTALEDLKIVDVDRKPAQVPADLRVNNLDRETAEALITRGFYLAGDPDNPDSSLTILPKSGEIDLQLSDGARYVLRFGNTTGESSAAEAAKHGKGAAAMETETSPGMDRYLFVMADFNQEAIPKPVMEQLPPEEKPAAKTDAKPSEPKAADAKAEAAKKSEPGKKDEPKAAAASEAVKSDAKKADVKKAPPLKLDAVAEAKKADARAAEQKRIDKENQRRQDEYTAKVVAGKKHVKDLNDRFAQWYYVIPGDVYDKIHLDRKAVVRKKEPPHDEHDHEHEHEHDSPLPVGPAGTINKLPDAPK